MTDATDVSCTSSSTGLLTGVRVVEFAHVIAAPLAGTLLADHGAEVIHVEDPGRGDPGRFQGAPKDGHYLWWKVSARNKRSVTVDLRSAAGQDVARRLVDWADVVITNIRFDTLVSWGLDWNSLHAIKPQLVMLQITGFGANTTKRNAPGYGKVGEARSGVVNVTGFPDGPPLHTGFSHADTVTALMGAFSVQAALFRKATDPEFDGEWIDLALNETLFRLIEWQVIYYDQLGIVPERSGNRLAVAPAAVVNCYLTADRQWLTVTSGTPRSVQHVAELVGIDAAAVATVELQAANRDVLDDALRSWIGERRLDECVELMVERGVVASPILSVADIVADPTYAERGSIVTVDDDDLGPIRMQNVVPRFDRHPGKVWRSGPRLGGDNELVLKQYLGYDDDGYEELVRTGVIAAAERGRT